MTTIERKDTPQNINKTDKQDKEQTNKNDKQQ